MVKEEYCLQGLRGAKTCMSYWIDLIKEQPHRYKCVIKIGSNFLANIEYTINRNKNKITFAEDIYAPVKSKEYPYLFFFDNKSNPVYPNSLFEVIEEEQ
jgi:hypothetical protein